MNAVTQENGYDDEIELVLAYHKGDVRAAIESLLKDRDFLIKEIEYASLAMSMGFARGWKPTVFSK
ncbi:CUE domain-containing protein [Brucella gallinifaecis]|uniref:CUE domain-containing protein n=1 Tax=Brucella gallinifaecis TaxID=215590 RepID=UPI002361FC98|nr:CUE domain-containing protein [Brucella gallinifaecis]